MNAITNIMTTILTTSNSGVERRQAVEALSQLLPLPAERVKDIEGVLKTLAAEVKVQPATAIALEHLIIAIARTTSRDRDAKSYLTLRDTIVNIIQTHPLVSGIAIRGLSAPTEFSIDTLSQIAKLNPGDDQGQLRGKAFRILFRLSPEVAKSLNAPDAKAECISILRRRLSAEPPSTDVYDQMQSELQALMTF